MKTITIELDNTSIDNAIKELEKYKKILDEKAKKIVEKLAILGAREASVRFSSAIYDGVNFVDVTATSTETGWAIIAKGQAVAFLEFGAGVYYNRGEPYPNPRPAGIAGIGEYGKGRGKRKAWGYYDETGRLIITRGNPAAMGMWYATQEMEREILKIAKEVFATND